MTTLTKIDEKLDMLEPGSLRHKTLMALRQFRASWVELGRLLTEVVYGGDYKEWGYDDFEVYCARELGLKKPTVQKLMVSYNYMKKHEPGRLDAFEHAGRDEITPNIPDYQTVELLHRARQDKEGLDEESMTELHRRAFDGESEEPDLRKEIRQHLRPSASPEEMAGGAQARQAEKTKILRLARELRRLLVHTKAVPGGLKDRIEQCLVELEALD